MTHGRLDCSLLGRHRPVIAHCTDSEDFPAKVQPLRYVASMHDSPYISHVFRINSTHSSIRPVAGSRVPGTNTHTVCLRMWSSSVVYIPCYFALIQTYPALLPLSTNLPDQAPGRSCWLSAAPEKTRHAAAEPVGKAGYRPRGPRPAQRPCASLPRRAGRSM